MEKVSRRKALSLIPAAVASVAAPVAVSAVPVEHPSERVVRLMRELRDALSDAAGLNGQFMAEVHPHGQFNSIMLEDVGWRAKRLASAENAARFLRMQDDWTPERRQRHFASKLKHALEDQRPGKWTVNHVADDDGTPCAVMVVFDQFADDPMAFPKFSRFGC